MQTELLDVPKMCSMGKMPSGSKATRGGAEARKIFYREKAEDSIVPSLLFSHPSKGTLYRTRIMLYAWTCTKKNTEAAAIAM